MTIELKSREKIYLSARDLAKSFDCGVSTIWRWASNGTIPEPIKIGGMTRWRKAEIIEAFPDLADAA